MFFSNFFTLALTLGMGIGGDHFLFNTQIQNSRFDRGSGRFLNFAKYHYLFNIKIQNSTAAAVELKIVLATNTNVIPKFKIRPRQRPDFEFC